MTPEKKLKLNAPYFMETNADTEESIFYNFTRLVDSSKGIDRK